MKKILYILCLVFPGLINAQGTITGMVSDGESKETLFGANLRLAGTTVGAVADAQGHFKLERVAPGDYTLIATFIGYEPVTLSVAVRQNEITTTTIRMKPGDIELQDVTVYAHSEASLNTLSRLDIKLRPTNTSQDILRMVPGLFIAQHAGGGKAEQIFLRGFDVDHGTDVNLEVDGLPVNLVSHAHGQGYADLHFLIPELVNYVDFNKGPYYVDKGDFTTAGYVDFQTKNQLTKNFALIEAGRYGTLRNVLGVNLISSRHPQTSAYVATEWVASRGFVESPQDLRRINITGKVSTQFNGGRRLTVGATYFTSRWNASGQIPNRAVESGMITRYGSIDNTEGGETSRANVNVIYLRPFSNGALLKQQLYTISYDFDLYSNFTFFSNDPVHGDQIEQSERRMIYGYKANYSRSGWWGGKRIKTEIGGGLRYDDINRIGLFHTEKRQFIDAKKFGYVDESNANLFGSISLSLTDQLTISTSARLDYFWFKYKNEINKRVDSQEKARISPKVSMSYQLNTKTEIYLRSGIGFHSNDARVVIANEGKDILPRAYGVDLGMNSKITENLLLNVALWRLDLDQEFVYVGDEGIVEPSGKTQREGIDLSMRYQLSHGLFLDTDINVTRPRTKTENEKYIPLAPTFSSIGGISFNLQDGLNGGFRFRYLGDRPANADNSLVAKGYFLADAVISLTKPKYEISISGENLLNSTWKEAQFDTESRLADESEPVSEIHFTPGTPLFLKAKFTFFF